MSSFFYRNAQFFVGLGFGLVLAGGLMLAGTAKDTPPSKAEVEALARSYGMVYREEVLPWENTTEKAPASAAEAEKHKEQEEQGEQPKQEEQQVQVIRVYIPGGITSEQIGLILAQKGVITDAEAFTQRVRARGVSTRLRAGYYDLAPNMTIDEIIDRLLIREKEAGE